MTKDDENALLRICALCVAVLLVLTVCMIRYLPSDFAIVLASWIMLSISVGVTFGHCVLNDP